jgi:hypothetical protein
MSPVKLLISKHPAMTYFALTFAISWGLVRVVVGPGGVPGWSRVNFNARFRRRLSTFDN